MTWDQALQWRKKAEKKKVRQALAPITNRRKNRTNKQTNWMGITWIKLVPLKWPVSGTGRREVLRMRCRWNTSCLRCYVKHMNTKKTPKTFKVKPLQYVPLQSIPKISTFTSFFTASMFVHMHCLLPSIQPVPLLTTLEKLCNRLMVVVVKRLVVCLQLESWIW